MNGVIDNELVATDSGMIFFHDDINLSYISKNENPFFPVQKGRSQ